MKCPFCGSEDNFAQRRVNAPDGWRIVCSTCGAEGPPADLPAVARAKWESRVVEKPAKVFEPSTPLRALTPMQFHTIAQAAADRSRMFSKAAVYDTKLNIDPTFRRRAEGIRERASARFLKVLEECAK